MTIVSTDGFKKGPSWPVFTVVVATLTMLFGMALVLILLLLKFNYASAGIEIIPPPPTATPAPSPTPSPLLVHVAGAVVHPGVVQVPNAARVRDAIDAAGGLLSTADEQQINLVELLVDGQYLWVPVVDEVTQPAPVAKPAVDKLSTPGLININVATAEELIGLPGIGEATAAKIIAYREEHGPFEDTEQIMEVPGIGEGKYNGFKELITVGP